MNNIETLILNPSAVFDAERMTVAAARLTQRGHRIQNLADFMNLYYKSYTPELMRKLIGLPHPTIQKLAAINVVVVGASRRFLAQITRHQNEVKFVSASLQYSDYSDGADFVVPWEILDAGDEATEAFLAACKASMANYKLAIEQGMSNDTAGYLAPQALRNVLIISATPYQWKHMIRQRTCNRNTPETKYVMELIGRELTELAPALFEDALPACMTGGCQEGDMRCRERRYQPDPHHS